MRSKKSCKPLKAKNFFTERSNSFNQTRQISIFTASELKVRSNIPGSTKTARSRLRSCGIRARRAAPKLNLTNTLIVDRLAFAISQESFNSRNVIFFDEVTVSSSRNDQFLFIAWMASDVMLALGLSVRRRAA